MNTRRVAVLLGTAAFLVAIAVVAGVVEIAVTRPTIVVIGLVALVVALSALSRGHGVRTRFGTPDPERRGSVPVPGRSLSGTVDEFRAVTAGHTASSRRLRSGLRGAAVAVLTRFEGDSVEDATRRIENGTWTDDRVAAAFLSDSVEPPARSLRTRLAAVVTPAGNTPFQSGIRHAVAAIVAVGDDGERTEIDRQSLPEYDPEPDDLRGGFSRPGPTANAQSRTRTTTTAVDGIEAHRRRLTEHWTGIGAVALLAVGIGAVADSPAIVLAGVVGVGYAGFARAFDPPELELSLDRTLSDDDPEPGDEIDVTVTLTNESGSFVPDLRFVDGVPADMAVTEGSSRLGTALRPGESVTLEYTVTARRGTHAFDPAIAIARDLSRSVEREFLVDTETTVVCEPSLQPLATDVPIRSATTSFAGRVQTADGGSGTTIHSVREYRKSDPLSRIDWNRHAKTGDLATLEFHEERTARVVVLVDARLATYCAPDPDATHAVDRSVDAAGRIGTALLATGETVGLAALGPVARDGGREESSDAEQCWLPPASGRHHELQFRNLLATHPQFSTLPPSSACQWRRQLRSLRRRLSDDSQIILLTPLSDSVGGDIARRLEARGHPVTVISPDPTADRTAGQQLARVARNVRRTDLQRAGIPVIDWPDDESLDTAIARHAGVRR
ncbi:DUF58 domain-containing protein [Natronorubrum sp. JWXQ-INN-674]|uniref:DUF58 domain-containing protein n=1 Tax=Natronorubrum halalkaliphilum TaxID=2691917 RepID=A0A6B0VQL1_9EURY|nr:DUF58 domain-containing protein [Natronorubrum halalkaliphilum]MXV62769.1 DUF58 domain-containing protein [Natronorubrum halalkaliphilum]